MGRWRHKKHERGPMRLFGCLTVIVMFCVLGLIGIFYVELIKRDVAPDEYWYLVTGSIITSVQGTADAIERTAGYIASDPEIRRLFAEKLGPFTPGAESSSESRRGPRSGDRTPSAPQGASRPRGTSREARRARPPSEPRP